MKTKVCDVSAIVGAMLSIIIIATSFWSSAQESKQGDLPSLVPLFGKVDSLVREYYPEASLTNLENTIHFEYRARDFMVHEPLMDGNWQNAQQVRGPNRNGIVCDITLYPGKYENTQWVWIRDPSGHRYWIYDKRYYRELLFIPYSSTQNCHLYVLLRVPANASERFIEKFDDLISNFGDNLKSTNLHKD